MALDAVPASVDDIEDAQLSVDDTRAARSALVEPGPTEARIREPTAAERATVPGTQCIWVKTFGCSHNQSDSEYMMGVLQAYGYKCALHGPPCIAPRGSARPVPLRCLVAPALLLSTPWSALVSKLTHTCAAPSAACRRPSGDPAEMQYRLHLQADL